MGLSCLGKGREYLGFPQLLCSPQSEDKIKAITNLYGPLMALNHVVQQDYFPKALVPLLLAFITK